MKADLDSKQLKAEELPLKALSQVVSGNGNSKPSVSMGQLSRLQEKVFFGNSLMLILNVTNNF